MMLFQVFLKMFFKVLFCFMPLDSNLSGEAKNLKVRIKVVNICLSEKHLTSFCIKDLVNYN